MDDDRTCWSCGGEGYHDGDCTCWEDTCCCLVPDPPVCDLCGGTGSLGEDREDAA